MSSKARHQSDRLRGRAERIARILVESNLSIESVCLFGSAARGDATRWSDIDLLVTGRDDSLTAVDLRQRLRRNRAADRVSLLYYPTNEFMQHHAEGALFIAHVLYEGKILIDTSGELTRVFEQPFKPKRRINEELQIQLSRLDPYTDLNRFNNNFLFCLSHLYVIGKGIIMLKLAEKGHLEFHRDRAFRTYEKLVPAMREDAGRITMLRPFYSLVTRRKPEPLPFSYIGAEKEARAALDSLRALAAK